MRPHYLLLCFSLAAYGGSTANGQGLLKKIKNAANAAINNSAGTSGNNQTNTNTGTDAAGNNRNRPNNRGGEGLITTPPDVNENLQSAETSFKAANYSEARYAVQQAMLGIELQIGQAILKSLPATIAGLQKDSARDQVTSTGWGWVGLTIQREYENNDKQFTFTLANNAAWMQAINLYFTSGAYAQSTGGQQNWKQTKLKGNRAVIEYEDNSGYKLSVPLGQTSLLVLQGVNFANEQEMMTAAGQIDLEKIKSLLGEK